MEAAVKTTAVYALTPQGAALGRRIAMELDADLFLRQGPAPDVSEVEEGITAFPSLPLLVREMFPRYRRHVFICAAGIVLRCIAPLLGTKASDPAVVVLDQRGRFAVSLLSGHLGGANDLARRLAAFTGGEAVITTATDTEGLPSLDTLASAKGLVIRNLPAVKAVNAALLKGAPVDLHDPHDLLGLAGSEHARLFRPLTAVPEAGHPTARTGETAGPTGSAGPAVIVSCRDYDGDASRLILHPRLIHAGIGCRRGTPADGITDALSGVLAESGIAAASLASLATAGIKRDEEGLLEAASRLGLPLRFYASGELSTMPVSTPSPKAREVLGVEGVCEAAALLAARDAAASDSGSFRLLLAKQVRRGVTVALAEHIPACSGSEYLKGTSMQHITSPAPLHIIGTGPGDPGLVAPQALEALARGRAVFGYGRYLDLLPPEFLEGKRLAPSGMKQEMARCEAAMDAALGGEESVLVSSGDPGVYAMAGLVFELMAKRGLSLRELPVSVTPGIPALCAAAALLGAPLMHDFAAVSLSDLLTPWEQIEQRLFHALAGDFVLALYNPRSRGRRDHLARALELALAARSGETPLGHVRNAYRPEQGVRLHRLRDFDPEDADMLSIILLGNSSTRFLHAPGPDPLDWQAGARIYTPRGYMEKYGNRRPAHKELP